MTSNPQLSIIIPTRDRPALLPRAVASALAACEDFAEVVVIEDSCASAAQALTDFTSDLRLTIIANQGPAGVSGARNYGVQAARGKTLLFLDDDDELIENYTSRVLEIASCEKAQWGFARQRVRYNPDDDSVIGAKPKSAWRGGVADSRVAFRRRIAALSSGFWINKSLYRDIGELCVEQTIDEDTDLCCRLVGAGYQPWFEDRAAVILDRIPETARLTNQTTAAVRAESYFRTFSRNIESCRHIRGAPAFLIFRAQRMILRSGRLDMLPLLAGELRNPFLRTGLILKQLIYSSQTR